MANRTLVFCRETPSPTIKDIMDMFSEEALEIKLGDDYDDEDPAWGELMLIYDIEEEPIIIQCHDDDDTGEFTEERDNLIELINETDQTDTKHMLSHLDETCFVIVVPEISDNLNDGSVVQNALVKYFCTDFRGLAYTEHEGVYESEELILALD